MKCFVTGASGFIGAHLVRQLAAEGHEVRCLLKPGSDTSGLQGLRFEAVVGDITDKSDVLARKMDGCDWVFHAAAIHHLGSRSFGPMIKTNVLGTQKVVRAAIQAEVGRIIHTSSADCVARPSAPPGAPGDRTTPSTEAMRVSEVHLKHPYPRSKWQAEVAVREAALAGIPIVIVNPTFPFGAFDAKPTPTGRLVTRFIDGPGWLSRAGMPAGISLVHVKDVATGHIRAAELGQVGERYLLGHCGGNWTRQEVWQCLSRLSGVPVPNDPPSTSVALLLAWMEETVAGALRRPPRLTLQEVRRCSLHGWYDCGKADRAWPLSKAAPESALAEAVEWFRLHRSR